VTSVIILFALLCSFDPSHSAPRHTVHQGWGWCDAYQCWSSKFARLIHFYTERSSMKILGARARVQWCMMHRRNIGTKIIQSFPQKNYFAAMASSPPYWATLACC